MEMQREFVSRAKMQMLSESLDGKPTFLEFACIQSMFSVAGRRKELDGNYYILDGFDSLLEEAYASSEKSYFSTDLFTVKGYNTTNLETVAMLSFLLLESPFLTLSDRIDEITKGTCNRLYDLFDSAEKPDYGIFATCASRLSDTPAFHCALIGIIYSQRQGKLDCETDFFSTYSEAMKKAGLEKSVLVHMIPERISDTLFERDSLSLVYRGNSDKAVDDLIRTVDRITAKPFLPDSKDCRDMLDLLCWSYRLQMRYIHILAELGKWIKEQDES